MIHHHRGRPLVGHPSRSERFERDGGGLLLVAVASLSATAALVLRLMIG